LENFHRYDKIRRNKQQKIIEFSQYKIILFRVTIKKIIKEVKKMESIKEIRFAKQQKYEEQQDQRDFNKFGYGALITSENNDVRGDGAACSSSVIACGGAINKNRF
jgi:hypothetical protein